MAEEVYKILQGRLRLKQAKQVKLVSYELNHFCHLVHGFSWGVKAHRSYTMCITLLIDKIISAKNARAWVSMNFI